MDCFQADSGRCWALLGAAGPAGSLAWASNMGFVPNMYLMRVERSQCT